MSRPIRIPVETDALGAARDIDTLASKAESAEGKFSGLGKAAAGIAAGAGAAAAAWEGFNQALDKEKSVDRLSAALGSTPAVAERYGRIASKVYAGAWGESLDDVTHAVESVKSSFGDLSSSGGLRTVTQQALDFASIFETEVPRATAVASTVVKSGLAKTATEAFDLMTASAQKVPAALRENVFDAAEEYSSFFATLGYSGEQAFTLLARGAQKGQYGIDKVGDAIKEFTIRATDGSKASSDAYKAIGLDAEAMATKIAKGGKGAQDATSQVVKGLLNIKDPAKQAQTAIALFGTPLEDLNVKDIPDFLQSLQTGSDGLGKWEGSIKKAGDTLNDNASTRIETFKRSVQTAFVDVLGNKVIPFVEKYEGSLDTIGPVLGVVTTGIVAFKVASIAAGAAAAIQAAGTTAATGATFSLNAALRANPIGLIVTLLTVLAAGLVVAYQKSDTFRSIVDKAFSVVKSAASGMWDGVKVVFKAMQDGFEAVGRAGTWLWNNALQPAFKFIVNGIGSILDLWASMLGTLAKVPGFGWAKDAADAMANAADKAHAMAEGIRKIPPTKTVNVTVAYKYTGLRGPGGSGPTRGGDDDFMPSGRTAFDAGKTFGRNTVSGFTTGLTSTLDYMKTKVGDAADKAGKKAVEAIRNRLDKAKALRQTVLDLRDSIAGALTGDLFGGTGDETGTALDKFRAAVSAAKATADQVLNATKALIDKGVSKTFLDKLMASGNTELIVQLGAAGDAAQLAKAYEGVIATNEQSGRLVAEEVVGVRLDNIGKTIRDLMAQLAQRDKEQKQRERTVSVRLSSEQRSQLERGREIRLDLDMWESAGGRQTA